MLSRVASADFDAELFLSASATLFAVVSFSYAVKDVFGEIVPSMLAVRAPPRPAPAPRPAALLALGTVYFAVGASALLRSRVFVTFIGYTRDATVLPAAASKPTHGAGGGCAPCPRARLRCAVSGGAHFNGGACLVALWRGVLMCMAWNGIELALESAREMLAFAPSPGAAAPSAASRLGFDLALAGLASAILISQRQLLRQFHGDDAHAAVWEGPADEHDAEDRGSRDS